MENIPSKIKDAAKNLTHSFIILDALKNDSSPDELVYMETIAKISTIESKYTPAEIEANNLLCDIW